MEREFDLIERKYNKLIEQKTIFAKRALARIHYILQEGVGEDDNIIKLINLLDRSEKKDEILEEMQGRIRFTAQFKNITDDSFSNRRERAAGEFMPVVLEDSGKGAAPEMTDFVPKPLYTKKQLQSFREKNMVTVPLSQPSRRSGQWKIWRNCCFYGRRRPRIVWERTPCVWKARLRAKMDLLIRSW